MPMLIVEAAKPLQPIQVIFLPVDNREPLQLDAKVSCLRTHVHTSGAGHRLGRIPRDNEVQGDLAACYLLTYMYSSHIVLNVVIY
ncbi:hypothetical protein SR89_13295 [Klebsiella aerogenes]|nr:hypothetical protein SR89_13295 [Klebsiella aerogenes]